MTEDTGLTSADFSRPRHHHHHHHHSTAPLEHTRTPESKRHVLTETATSSQTSPVERVTHCYESKTLHEDLATREHENTSTAPAEDGEEGGAVVTCSEDSPDIQAGSNRDMSSEFVGHVDHAEPFDPRTAESSENVTRQEMAPNTSYQRMST